MANTKKVKSTGRYGSRYGVGIKKRVLKVEEKQKKKVVCPFCGFKTIKRLAAGLFTCKKCEAKFTGGAYEAETLIGKTIKKMVNQKSFVAQAAELIKVTEEAGKSSYSDIEQEVAKAMNEDEPEEKIVKKTIKKKVVKKKAIKAVNEEKEVEEVKEEKEEKEASKEE
jgi:large subunit ribosomal protein L37Ae